MPGGNRTRKAAAKPSTGLSEGERAAMKERMRELKAQAEGADGEKQLLAKIAEMGPSDRSMAKRIHEIVKANAPLLSSRTWYGMPAYSKDDEVICFFKAAEKFKSRYATLGFSDEAKLDEGHMWPTDFALTELTSVEEAKIIALLKRALA